MGIRKRAFLFLCIFTAALTAYGEDMTANKDSINIEDSLTHKRSWFNRFLDYFNDANKNKKHKKFDFSFIGGPHYNSDIEFGVGLVAA